MLQVSPMCVAYNKSNNTFARNNGTLSFGGKITKFLGKQVLDKGIEAGLAIALPEVELGVLAMEALKWGGKKLVKHGKKHIANQIERKKGDIVTAVGEYTGAKLDSFTGSLRGDGIEIVNPRSVKMLPPGSSGEMTLSKGNFGRNNIYQIPQERNLIELQGTGHPMDAQHEEYFPDYMRAEAPVDPYEQVIARLKAEEDQAIRMSQMNSGRKRKDKAIIDKLVAKQAQAEAMRGSHSGTSYQMPIYQEVRIEKTPVRSRKGQDIIDKLAAEEKMRMSQMNSQAPLSRQMPIYQEVHIEETPKKRRKAQDIIDKLAAQEAQMNPQAPSNRRKSRY